MYSSMLCTNDKPGQCVDSALHTSSVDPAVLSLFLQTRSAHKWGIAGTQCSWGQELLHCRKIPVFLTYHGVVISPVHRQLNNEAYSATFLIHKRSSLINRFRLNSMKIIFLERKKVKTLSAASKCWSDYTPHVGVAQNNTLLTQFFPGLHLLTITGCWV